MLSFTKFTQTILNKKNVKTHLSTGGGKGAIICGCGGIGGCGGCGWNGLPGGANPGPGKWPCCGGGGPGGNPPPEPGRAEGLPNGPGAA